MNQVSKRKFRSVDNFSTLTGVGVLVCDDNGNEIASTNEYNSSKSALIYLQNLCGVEEQAKISLIHGIFQASRFGGKYIFLSPNGFAFFVSPVIRGGTRVFSLIGGPVLMMEHDDFIESELQRRVEDFDRNEAKSYIADIPVFDSETVSILSDQLFVNAYFLGDSSALSYDTGVEADKLTEFLNSERAEGGEFFDNTMLEEERKLIKTLASHDSPLSRALINDILGKIILHSDSNPEFTKSRTLELIILFSQQAVQDGADEAEIARKTQRYFEEIDRLDNFNSYIVWLNDVLNSFAVKFFRGQGNKSDDPVRDAKRYIQAEYARRLTLEEVAAVVFISPSYLSKLFNSETGQSFKEYINDIRIAESKKLLKSTEMSLSEISNTVGFVDQSYFSRVFKLRAGMAPKDWRKEG
jgi:AraC-type DNA-binding domain-containing proteins